MIFDSTDTQGLLVAVESAVGFAVGVAVFAAGFSAGFAVGSVVTTPVKSPMDVDVGSGSIGISFIEPGKLNIPVAVAPMLHVHW